MNTSRAVDPATADLASSWPAGMSWRAVASADAAIRGLVHEPDPVRIARVAETGLALDRVAECREPLRRATDAVRGGLAAAMPAFGLLCAGDVASGRWSEAGRLAEEGLALCGPGHPRAGASLRLAQAFMAAPPWCVPDASASRGHGCGIP